MTTEDYKRKLTAILSADVVGYSRLMADDEAATVKTLETYKGVMSSLIKQHRGIEAIDKANSVVASDLWRIWSPGMKEVPQLPRFKEFVKEIGLVEYRKEYGWPDLCRPIGNDDFECD